MGVNKVGGVCFDIFYDKFDEGFFVDCFLIYIFGCVFLGVSGKVVWDEFFGNGCG